MVFKHDCTSAVALVHVGCGFRNFCREHLVRNTRKHMFNMLFFTHDIRASWHFGGWIWNTHTHTQRFPYENACQWGQHIRVSVVLRKHEETHPKSITLRKNTARVLTSSQAEKSRQSMHVKFAAATMFANKSVSFEVENCPCSDEHRFQCQTTGISSCFLIFAFCLTYVLFHLIFPYLWLEV